MRILMVLTSHDQLGNTGRKTGFWLEEFAAPYYVLRDAGVELRLQAFSYYAFPTRVFFNATYGFDQFNRYFSNTGAAVTYGKEWNFHFGVLFGFDLD